jgi:YfiH family protein
MIVDMFSLPEPTEAFAWVQAEPGPGLVCHPLQSVAPHIFTSRHWLLGSRFANVTRDGDQKQWSEVASALACRVQNLTRVRQVHGAAVFVARGATDREPEADVIISDNQELALAVRAADCVPLLIADPETGAIAAIHAGWQGLALRTIQAGVVALCHEFGARAADLIAAAGPSIGACCYEVGVTVKDRFEAAGFNDVELSQWFSSDPRPTARNPSMPGLRVGRPDHWFFDGWRATRDQLRAEGLVDEAIFIAELCTASHPHTFCSYRRDGSPAGRLAGAIRRRPPGP